MKKILLSIFILLISNPCFAEVRKARIFDIGKTSEKPRFTQETTIEDSSPTEKKWSSQIKNAKEEVVMTEKATFTGENITYQYIEQLQINEAYELSVDGDKAKFNTYKIIDGKKADLTETKTITIDNDFITGPATEFYLKKKWQDLTDSKKVNVDFGVFELSRAVGLFI